MNGLSLFTGSGIGELTFKEIIPAYRTVGYVEFDDFCQALIMRRIADGILDDAPIWSDVRDFPASLYAGTVDFISAGFPCQPFSLAGKRQGEKDKRNMWPDTRRIISEIRPRYVFLENVANLIAHPYFRTIKADLAALNYDDEQDVVSAAFAGANHLRERLWCLSNDPRSITEYERQKRKVVREKQKAYTRRTGEKVPDSIGSRELQSERSKQNERGWISDSSKDVAYSICTGLSQSTQGGVAIISRPFRPSERSEPCRRAPKGRGNWEVEPDVGRVANGVANRVDRIKCLGNGWVPQVVARILKVTDSH